MGLSLFIIAVTFLPFMTRLLLELRTTFGWMWNEWQLYSQLWREILKDQIKVIFSMLPFISPIVNLAKIVRLSQIDDGDVEAENIQLQIGSLSNWEPFLESLPQFIVQLYVTINETPNTSYPHQL